MTQDEIRKIADNWSYKAIDAWKEQKSIGIRKLISDTIIEALNSVSEHYFIVEKSKVREEYRDACDEVAFETATKSDCHLQTAIGRKYAIESIFGTDAFKEE